LNDSEGRRRALRGGTEENHDSSDINIPSSVRHLNAECPLLSERRRQQISTFQMRLTGNSRAKYLPCNSNISEVIQPRYACRSAVTPSRAPVKCIVLSCTVPCLARQKDTTHSLFALPRRNSVSVSQSINKQLILPQLVNIFSPFYRTRRSITVFTKAPLAVPILSNILGPEGGTR